MTVNGSLIQKLAYDGNRYVGRLENDQAISEFYVLSWGPKTIHFLGRNLYPTSNGLIEEADMTGTIGSDGSSVSDGRGTWTTVHTGGFSFTLQWDKSEANMQSFKRVDNIPPAGHDIRDEIHEALYGRPDQQIYGELQWSPSRTHPDIMLPPLAADEFASFPRDLRAILRPTHDTKLMKPDSLKAPCSEARSETNSTKALEIGKFAIRDLEYDRGYCWLKRANELGNATAAPLLGVTNMEGWGEPKDLAEAFRIFTVRNDVWSLYFREQCYLKGIGTAPNPQEAKHLDLMIQLSPVGEEMLYAIGQDEAETQLNYLKAHLELHPPMKTVGKSCRDVIARQAGLPDRVIGQDCHDITEVDQDAIKKALEDFQPSEPCIPADPFSGLCK